MTLILILLPVLTFLAGYLLCGWLAVLRERKHRRLAGQQYDYDPHYDEF